MTRAGGEPMTDAEREAFRKAADEMCAKWGHGGRLDVTRSYSPTEPIQVCCRDCGRTWRLTPDDGEYAS